MEYLTLGVIVKAFGLKGEVKILSTSDFRSQRYKRGRTLFLFKESTGERFPVHVKSYHAAGNIDFVGFTEYSDCTVVEALIGYLVQVEKDAKPLAKNSYYHSDLEACDVVDEHGTVLGHVAKVEEYSAQKSLRVKREGKPDMLVPFVPAFIQKVDLEKKQIVIIVWAGLL